MDTAARMNVMIPNTVIDPMMAAENPSISLTPSFSRFCLTAHALISSGLDDVLAIVLKAIKKSDPVRKCTKTNKPEISEISEIYAMWN